MTTAHHIVREYFPGASDEEANNILWNYTGFPGFWNGDPEAALREQLQHLKDVGFEQADKEMDEAVDVDVLMALVAQGTEPGVPNTEVAGSSPAEGTP